MKSFESVDFFTDKSLCNDPHSYFDYLRSKGPAVRLPHRGFVAITTYDEGLAVFRNEERFSSLNAAYGPNPLPFKPEGDDITGQIESHRGANPTFRIISSLDPPDHTKLRSLLMGLITPKRLKENEDFMWRLADRLIDEFIKDGSMEIFSQFAQPYATLVIADLLGVPEEDHKEFRKAFQGQGGTGAIDKPPATDEDFPLYLIADRFFPYIEERRRNPRKDVLTDLARVKYPDGSLPPTRDVVDLSTFLFGAGQETTVRVIGSMLRILGDDPALQKRLRAERSLIPNFVEEALRMEGAVKSGFRLARVRAKIGDVEMEPGTPLMMCIGGMNRDPHKFENPNEFQVNRQNARDHMSFGRGIHSCIGAPLARAELKVTLERLFDRTADIRIDEAKHGSPGNRNYQYAASYIMRGLTELHLTFTPK